MTSPLHIRLSPRSRKKININFRFGVCTIQCRMKKDWLFLHLLIFAMVILSGCVFSPTSTQNEANGQTDDALVEQAWQELFEQPEYLAATPSSDMLATPKRLGFFASEQKWYVLFTGNFPPASNSWFYAQMSCVAGHGDGKDYPITIYIIPHDGPPKGMYTTFAHQRHLIFRSKNDAEKAMTEQVWHCGQTPNYHTNIENHRSRVLVSQ